LNPFFLVKHATEIALGGHHSRLIDGTPEAYLAEYSLNTRSQKDTKWGCFLPSQMPLTYQP
jgi:hypothetical protein